MALALNNLKRVDMPLNKETNQLGKSMNPFILPAIGWIVPLLLSWKKVLDIK